jgi:hypothetical protein
MEEGRCQGVCWRVKQVNGSRGIGAEVVYVSVNVSIGVGRLEHEAVTTLAGESLGPVGAGCSCRHVVKIVVCTPLGDDRNSVFKLRRTCILSAPNDSSNEEQSYENALNVYMYDGIKSPTLQE